MDAIQSTLCLPNDMSCLTPALAYITELAGTAGFDKSEARQITLAMEEAITNVIKHGFSQGERAEFQIVCELSATGISFVIREKGVPYDPERAAVYTPPASIDEQSASGLGLFLMRKNMDEISFRNLGRDGREIRLTRRHRSARIDSILGKSEPAAPGERPPAGKQYTPDSFHIRPLRPEEAIEISRCAYNAYGYSYEEFIYYPEQIASLNKSGLMQSLVAVTAEDEIAAHLALKLKAPDDRIAEIGVGFVKPEFRRAGLLKTLVNTCIKHAAETGLFGLFGRPVTSHAISQKVINEYGFKDSGVFLAMFPRDVDFKQLTGRVRQKESGLLSFLRLSDDPDRPIHPPEQHAAMIREIYGWLRMNPPMPDPVPESSVDMPDETALDASSHNVLNIADIRVLTHGRAADRAVREKLRFYCLEHRDVIYLWLNLENPATRLMTGVFEQMGFFFSGILPRGLDGRDALILQYLNNLTIDYSMLAPFSGEAQKLLAYVRQQDPGMRQ